MGPLFGHLARDPHPATLMKLRAPRVYRWIEAMNTPEIQSPEFPDVPTEFAADDVLPGQTLELLRLCLRDVGGDLPRSAELFNDWVADKSGWPAGSVVSKDADEPSIGSFEVTLRGESVRAHAGLYPLWVLQRGLDWFASLSEAESKAGREPMIACDEEPLLDIQLDRRLTRVENRIALD